MKQATVAEYRLAVAVLARRSATKAVKARLKAQGVNLSYVPARDIAALARDYLAEHRVFFVVEAKQAIATWPEFARWRCAGISNSVQTQSPPKSTTSAVQNSSANWRANR
jgi:hypothetical protein